MISETALMDCENVPPEMSARFDQPWHFLGEVKGSPYHLHAMCGKCLTLERDSSMWYSELPIHYKPPIIVNMKSHLFITDDMLEVRVYFGVCDKCDSVYWARQGPPFKRARCLVPA